MTDDILTTLDAAKQDYMMADGRKSLATLADQLYAASRDARAEIVRLREERDKSDARYETARLWGTARMNERDALAKQLEREPNAATAVGDDKEHWHIWSDVPCPPGGCRMSPPVTPPSDDVREALGLLIDPNALELDAYPWPLNLADQILANFDVRFLTADFVDGSLMQAPAIQAVREVLNQVSEHMDEHAYSEIASALDDIPNCESASAMPHDEHAGAAEIVREALRQTALTVRMTAEGREVYVDRLADVILAAFDVQPKGRKQ